MLQQKFKANTGGGGNGFHCGTCTNGCKKKQEGAICGALILTIFLNAPSKWVATIT